MISYWSWTKFIWEIQRCFMWSWIVINQQTFAMIFVICVSRMMSQESRFSMLKFAAGSPQHVYFGKCASTSETIFAGLRSKVCLSTKTNKRISTWQTVDTLLNTVAFCTLFLFVLLFPPLLNIHMISPWSNHGICRFTPRWGWTVGDLPPRSCERTSQVFRNLILFPKKIQKVNTLWATKKWRAGTKPGIGKCLRKGLNIAVWTAKKSLRKSEISRWGSCP